MSYIWEEGICLISMTKLMPLMLRRCIQFIWRRF